VNIFSGEKMDSMPNEPTDNFEDDPKIKKKSPHLSESDLAHEDDTASSIELKRAR
jgi:hypothetical protein